MSERKSMSKKTRFEVFKRDSFTCQYCGAKAPDVVLQVDHVQPVADGGSDALLNLLTSCAACNGGKGARPLDDASVVEKQRRQLEQLQERREQIDMMVDWQKGLGNVDDYATEKLVDYWAELAPGWVLNEHGQKHLRKLIKQFGIERVSDAMRTSATQYLEFEGDPPKTTESSWGVAWDYVGRICSVRKRSEGKPHMESIFRFRGRLRGKLSWINERETLELMEEAFDAGVSLEDLESLINHHRNWNAWADNVRTWIAEKETEQA